MTSMARQLLYHFQINSSRYIIMQKQNKKQSQITRSITGPFHRTNKRQRTKHYCLPLTLMVA